jgi:hypothetical protein
MLVEECYLKDIWGNGGMDPRIRYFSFTGMSLVSCKVPWFVFNNVLSTVYCLA